MQVDAAAADASASAAGDEYAHIMAPFLERANSVRLGFSLLFVFRYVVLIPFRTAVLRPPLQVISTMQARVDELSATLARVVELFGEPSKKIEAEAFFGIFRSLVLDMKVSSCRMLRAVSDTVIGMQRAKSDVDARAARDAKAKQRASAAVVSSRARPGRARHFAPSLTFLGYWCARSN